MENACENVSYKIHPNKFAIQFAFRLSPIQSTFNITNIKLIEHTVMISAITISVEHIDTLFMRHLTSL